MQSKSKSAQIYLTAWLTCCLSLAACMPDASSPRTGSAVDSAAAASHVVNVEISQMRFVPDSVVVRGGDTVVFVNKDMVTHCVTQWPDRSWTSGMLAADSSFAWVATISTGYYCAIHQVMKGKIVVR